MTIATTFTTTCPCGVTVDFIEGVEQPHNCGPISPQAVRDAWVEGYESAIAEIKASHDRHAGQCRFEWPTP